jgi:hypothetical protein
MRRIGAWRAFALWSAYAVHKGAGFCSRKEPAALSMAKSMSMGTVSICDQDLIGILQFVSLSIIDTRPAVKCASEQLNMDAVVHPALSSHTLSVSQSLVFWSEAFTSTYKLHESIVLYL